MLAMFTALPLSELITYLLIFCVSLVLATVSWPLLRGDGRAVAVDSAISATNGTGTNREMGLARQWAQQSHLIEAGLTRQYAALELHRRAHLQINSLDYEFNHLMRDLRHFSNAGVAA